MKQAAFVVLGTGKKVVYADNLANLTKKPTLQLGTQKSSTADNLNRFSQTHSISQLVICSEYQQIQPNQTKTKHSLAAESVRPENGLYRYQNPGRSLSIEIF